MIITKSRDHCGLEFLSTRKGMAEGSHEIEQQAKVCITCDLPVDDVKVEFINTPTCNFIHDTNIICGVSPPRLQRCGHCSGSQSETLAPYVGQGKMFFFNWTTMDHGHTLCIVLIAWYTWGAYQFFVGISQPCPRPKQLPPLLQELLVITESSEELLTRLGGNMRVNDRQSWRPNPRWLGCFR